MSVDKEAEKLIEAIRKTRKKASESDVLVCGTIGQCVIDMFREGQDVTLASVLARMQLELSPKSDTDMEHMRLGSAIDFLQRLNSKS